MLELDREVARSHRTGEPLVIAFVDVDGLKAINDTAGHAAGDAVLRAASDTIRNHLRPYDVVVRFGGDEFLCGLPDISEAQASQRFDLIHSQLAADHQASLTVGFACLEQGETLDGLVARADAAMYARR